MGPSPSVPLRVAMVVYHFWPGLEGGAERQCRRLGTALVRRGIGCRVFTTRQDRGWPVFEAHEGLEIERLPCLPTLRRPLEPQPAPAPRRSRAPSPGGRGLRRSVADVHAGVNATLFLAGLARALRRYRPDLIHVHVATAAAGFCSWLGNRLGIPVLVKESNYPAFPPLEPFVPFSGAWERWRRRAHYVALNEATAADLVAKGVAEGLVSVIPNGVDLPGETGGRGGPGAVLYVGNFSRPLENKAFDVLIGAWSIVSRRRPEARLRLVGGGDHAPWRRLAEELGCAGTVEFTGFARDMEEHYRWASLLLLPSRREGMSNALLEAQSWGIPAVVSGIPGNLEVVEDGVSGLVAPVGDVEALADRTVELLRDPGRLRAMGERARASIESRYSVASTAGRVETLYRRLVAAGREGAE